jgi:radical SAM superfamily enzyme YgiQ (UPF0313 family)
LKTKKIKIGLVEIGDSFGGQYYFPYSMGILRAYAEKKLAANGNYQFLPIIYKRGNVDNYATLLSEADIIFYSVYLWNSKVSLAIAREAKRKNPEIINVFGGPNVPESSEKVTAFLQQYPFLDIASFGEGEIPFFKTIEKCSEREWEAVPSIAWKRPDNSLVVNEFKETIEDINDIPSPYLSGVFDELVRQNPEEKWQGRIETNRGCPFTCAFCYWGKKADRKLKQFDLTRVYGEIDWLARNKVEFVFCCDANFGILKRDLEIARKVTANKKSFSYPKAFSVQNTKNSRERIFELQKILNDEGLQKGVNLALQSLNEETLKHIERSNVDNKTYTELQQMFTKNNIPTFTDLIIGLPGETYDSFTEGVSEIIANGQHNRIQFLNLTILENTLMADPDYQQKHGLTIIETELIPHHSSLDMIESIVEMQHLVTATKAMPGRDWIKTRVFSWMASLLHFDKLLQIPFIILHEVCGISYKDLVEAFMEKADGQNILAGIVSALEEKAASIQQGGSEYSMSGKWLNTAWYPDELTVIKMSTGNEIENFYIEAEARLISLAKNYPAVIGPQVIADAVRMNRAVLKQPFLTENASIQCSYNIWEVYQAALRCDHEELAKGDFKYEIDRMSQQWTSWDDWCREVIWYGNKKGGYIYSVKRSVR